MADQVKTIKFKVITDAKEAKEELSNYQKAIKQLKSELNQNIANTMAVKGITALLSGIKAIGRIAIYRAIRSAIKAVTQAFSEGYNAAVEYSQLVGYELAGTVERLSTNLNTMKLTLGSLAGQTLMALEPILTWLMEVVTKVADKLAEMIAYLRGEDKYLKAVTQSTKNLAKAKQYLLGIDEINKVGDSSSDSSVTTTSYQVSPVDAQEAEKTKENVDSLLVGLVGIGAAIGTWDIVKIVNASKNLKSAKDIASTLSTALAGASKEGTIAATSIETGAAKASLGLGTVSTFLIPLAAMVGMTIWDIKRGTTSIEDFTKESTEGLSDTASSWEIANAGLKTWVDEGMPQVVDSTKTGLGTVAYKLDSWGGQWNQRMGEMKHTWKMMWIELEESDTIDMIELNINKFIYRIKQALISLKNWIIDLFDLDLRFENTSTASRAQMSIHAYADGGLPNNGELFVARERGAELIGNIGGKTSVMNNDQIVEAVSAGVANAVSSVMNGRGGQNINLYIDGKQIKNVVTKLQSNSARAYGV